MDAASRKYASFGLVTTALWIAPMPVGAQWTVTIRAMQNPVAVGQCTGIEVTIVDERGFPPVRPDRKQASGWDFDLEFTSAMPDAFAWRDERHRFLCAKAPTAPSALVVARYPAQHLKPVERVPGLTLQRSIEVTMQGVPAGLPPTLVSASVPPVGAAPTAQAAGQGYGAVPSPQPAPVAAPIDPATGYPAGAAPGMAPGVTPSYQGNGYGTPAALPSGYPAPVYSSPGPAAAYGGTPTVDPSQAYATPGTPGYPAGATPALPQPQQIPHGYVPGTAAPAPQPVAGGPYPADPASQTTQAGLAPQPTAAQPPPPPQARSFKQLFKKIGDHAKQQARDVAGNTVNYTADAANSVVDNTLTSGSDLVKTNVQSTAGGLSGVGQALFNGVKGKDDPKDLAVALSAGRVVLHQLRFQEHTATLDPSSGPLLAKLTQALLATPGQYLIEGHVDKTEEPRAQALSDQRAAAVKNALVSSGVPSTQLVATGYGATRPSNSGSGARIEIARTQ